MAGFVPGVTSGTSSTTSLSSASSAASQQLSANDFLKLLTTEMQNQDPTQPEDPTQSVAQLAQFSSLEASEEMNQSFQNFQSNFGVMQAANLIGKNVSVESTDSTGNSSTVTGSVTGIIVQNGSPYFTMNGTDGKPIVDQNGSPEQFATSQIIAIDG
jgi:flagellar basal-body rod modification protein FlgD